MNKITGQPYDTVTQQCTWHHNSKKKSAAKLAKMFNFSLCESDTEQNLINAVKQLSDMYLVDRLSPTEIAAKFGIIDQYFGHWMAICLKIPMITQEEAKKYREQTLDGKTIFRDKCKFKFTREQMIKIPGFNLIDTIGMYHPTKNPKGLDRDHIISVEAAWRNGWDPSNISHPANCQLIPHIDNVKKNSACGMEYQDLLDRIENWDNGVILDLDIQISAKQPRTQAHKDHIRKVATENHRRRKLAQAPGIQPGPIVLQTIERSSYSTPANPTKLSA
jgi:hypothetical protein